MVIKNKKVSCCPLPVWYRQTPPFHVNKQPTWRVICIVEGGSLYQFGDFYRKDTSFSNKRCSEERGQR